MDFGAGEGIGGWEAEGNLQVLLVEGDAGGDFSGGCGRFKVERVFGAGLGGGPGGEGAELGSY